MEEQEPIPGSNLEVPVVANAGAETEVSPAGETAPASETAPEPEPLETHDEAPAPAPEPAHAYAVGDRVGLLGRVRDIHDKGNIVIEIETSHPGGLFDSPQYVHLSESILHDGADLIYKRVQEIKRANG